MTSANIPERGSRGRPEGGGEDTERSGVPEPTLDADRLDIMGPALPLGAGPGRLIVRFGVLVLLVQVTGVVAA